MTKYIAQIAMIISLGYYTLSLMLVWILALLGDGEDVWDTFGLPIQSISPALWASIIGIIFSVFTLFSLGLTYWSLNGILKGGREQDFLQLAQRLRRTAIGLFGFWLGYNLLSGLMPYLLLFSVNPPLDVAIEWDPLDIDIVFVIVAITVLAISQTMDRAWDVEEETKLIL